MGRCNKKNTKQGAGPAGNKKINSNCPRKNKAGKKNNLRTLERKLAETKTVNQTDDSDSNSTDDKLQAGGTGQTGETHQGNKTGGKHTKAGSKENRNERDQNFKLKQETQNETQI